MDVLEKVEEEARRVGIIFDIEEMRNFREKAARANGEQNGLKGLSTIQEELAGSKEGSDLLPSSPAPELTDEELLAASIAYYAKKIKAVPG